MDIIKYTTKGPVVFAFEFSAVDCSGGIKLARIQGNQFASIYDRSRGPSGTAYAYVPPTFPTKNIVENAVHSKDHTTLVAAVKAAGLVDTLEGTGPFTVFAPTNKAFSKLPAGIVATLVMPENKDKLTQILTYHVVPGRLTAADLTKMVKQGGGKAELKTVEGEFLTVTMAGKGLDVTDAKGDVAKVTISDAMQSNGVIHTIDTVLLPGG